MDLPVGICLQNVEGANNFSEKTTKVINGPESIKALTEYDHVKTSLKVVDNFTDQQIKEEDITRKTNVIIAAADSVAIVLSSPMHRSQFKKENTWSTNRIIIAELREVIIFAYYAPHGGYPVSEGNIFMDNLTKAIGFCTKTKKLRNKRLIVLGDSNSMIGEEEKPSLALEHTVTLQEKSSNNGKKLLEVMADRGLFLLNSAHKYEFFGTPRPAFPW